MAVPRLRSVLAVVGLVAGIAACGGDSGPDREEFLAEVDAVCEKAQDELSELREPTTLPELADVLDEGAAINDEALADLEQIEPPDDDAEAYEQLLEDVRERNEALVDARDAADQGDEEEAIRIIEDGEQLSEEIREQAEDLGLEECPKEVELEPPADTGDDSATDDTDDEQASGRTGRGSLFTEEVAEESDLESDSDTYEDFVEIVDDSGALVIEVPAEWADVETAATPNVGPTIQASPDLASFEDSFDEPGVIFLAVAGGSDADMNALLDEAAPAECTSDGRDTYDDPVYAGQFEFFSSCGGTETQVVTVAATPKDGRDHVVLVGVQMVTERDLDALEVIFDTFNVVGELG